MAIYSVEVNGTERDALLESLYIQLVANGLDTFAIDFDSDDASFRPVLEDEVVILEDAVPVVGGLITTAPEECLGGPALDSIVTRVSVTSFSIYASFRYVTASIPSGTLKSFLVVLATYLAGYGVTLDGAQVDGPTITGLTFTRVRLDEVLNELNKRAPNYLWEIDANKVFRMFAAGSIAAPYDLLDTGPVRQVGDVTVEPTRDDTYANRLIIVVSGNGPATASQTFTAADGVTGGGLITFTADYPASSSLNDLYPNVLVIDGTVVGVIGFGATQLPGDNWYWDYTTSPATLVYTVGSPYAFPTGAQQISVDYAIGYPFEVIVEDVAAQASPVGIRERVIQVTENMTLQAATDLANAILDRAKTTLKVARWASDDTGWRPGQVLTIDLAKRATDASFLITDATLSMAPGSNVLRHSCTAVEGEIVQGNWRQPYKDWLGDKLGRGGSGGVSTFGVAAPPGGVLLRATLTLTDAQFKAAADVPQLINTLVDVGKRIKVVGASLRVKTTDGAYTNVDQDLAGVHLVCGGRRMSCGYVNDSTVPVAKFSDLVEAVHDKLSDLPIPAMDAIDGLMGSPQGSPATDQYVMGEDAPSLPDSTDLIGAGLYLLLYNNGAGAFTGGGSANGFRLNVLYVLEDIGLPAQAAIPAGSLAFSSGGTLVFVNPSTGARISDMNIGPAVVLGGGVVFLDSGEVCIAGTFPVGDIEIYNASLVLLGSAAAGGNLKGAGSNLSDGFYVFEGTSIVRYDTSGAVVQTWPGVGAYDHLGVVPDNSVAILGKNGDDHLDIYDLVGSTGPTTFATIAGDGLITSGSMVGVLRDGSVVSSWSDDDGDSHPFVAVHDSAGALIDTFDVGSAGDFTVALSICEDDLHFWVSVYIDASSLVRVSKIRISDGATIETFDKTTVNEADIDWDNAAFGVVR